MQIADLRTRERIRGKCPFNFEELAGDWLPYRNQVDDESIMIELTSLEELEEEKHPMVGSPLFKALRAAFAKYPHLGVLELYYI